MWQVVLISDNMTVTIKPTGKYEGFYWVARGAVTMGNMVYKAYVLQLKLKTRWW